MRKVISLLVLFITFIANSQESEIDSINFSLFDRFQYLRERAKYQEAKDDIEITLEKSKELNYQKGIYWSYIRLGNLECTLDNFKESVNYLDNAKEILKDSKDKVAIATLEIEYGRLYSKSKYSYDLALKSFDKAIKLSKEINDKEIRTKNLCFIYQNLYVTYWFLDDKDKGVEYLQKSEKLSLDIYNLTYLAHYHLSDCSNNNDSLKFYLDKLST